MMKWMAGVPGKDGTDWEGGVYKVSMEFTEEYPSRPPKCRFFSGSGGSTACSGFSAGDVVSTRTTGEALYMHSTYLSRD
jgi:hypothetical protein